MTPKNVTIFYHWNYFLPKSLHETQQSYKFAETELKFRIMAKKKPINTE